MIKTKKEMSTFAKEYGCPISVFKDGYFEEKINLFGYRQALSEFEYDIYTYDTEKSPDEIIDEINTSKRILIDEVKKMEDYVKFQELDMNLFAKTDDIPKGDIYKNTNINKKFISIDMKSANFIALAYLRKFGIEILDDAESYYEFVECSELIDRSIPSRWKGSRQFIFGNLNPKRQQKIQRFIMSELLKEIVSEDTEITISDVKKINNDELIIEISESFTNENKQVLLEKVREFEKILCNEIRLSNNSSNRLFEVETFELKYVSQLKCYIKYDFSNYYSFSLLKNVKCLNKLYYSIYMRAVRNQPVMPNDLTFYHEHNLSMLLDYPKFTHEDLIELLENKDPK